MSANPVKKPCLIALAILSVVLASAPAGAQRARAGFIYSLANFTGTIPYNQSRVVADKERNEIYVLYGGTVWIFNEAGMEVFHFGDDLDLGLVVRRRVRQRRRALHARAGP